ncbi:MAG: thermonuclease family protein [Acidimicrobiia bacterium]
MNWSGARHAWSDHQRARSSLVARIAAADAELRSASDRFIRAERNHRWAAELNPVELPIRMKHGEIGLGSVPGVELLETRRRDGADMWTVVDRGAVLFTDRRMVFDGGKEVSFLFADLTTDSLGPDGWTLAVSSRKRPHTLAGPTEQLVVCKQAVIDGTGGTDPRFRWRVLMDESTELRHRAKAAHREGVLELDGLTRPARPVSPAWVPATLALVLALAVPDSAVAPPPTAVIEALATTTTAAVPEPTVLGATVTTDVSLGMVARVVEVLSADTVSVRLESGERVSVRLAGVAAVKSVGPTARQTLAQLIGGRDVELVADAAAGADRYYLYLGGSLVNTELVSRGLARSDGVGLALADLFVTAAASAEQQAVGIWAPTTTTPSSTTTTQPTTTTTELVTTTTESGCHPSYEGACVPVNVEDVDCAGGSGDGPYYVGRVTVVGPDVYGLDRDGDGIGCE